MSRWLQAPLYIGLIAAQALYVWQFWRELMHLIHEMTANNITEAQIMLIVLGLIDVVMISNLLVMVIVVFMVLVGGDVDDDDISHRNPSLQGTL